MSHVTSGLQIGSHSATFQVLNMQMAYGTQVDGHADEAKLHGKPDKTLRFSLCSDNLEGISEGGSASWISIEKNKLLLIFYLVWTDLG